MTQGLKTGWSRSGPLSERIQAVVPVKPFRQYNVTSGQALDLTTVFGWVEYKVVAANRVWIAGSINLLGGRYPILCVYGAF